MAEAPSTNPAEEKKRAAIHTLGCRLNQGETRIIEDQLHEAGYVIVPFEEPADLGIIHTCVVTREAEAKSRKYIRRFIRTNPGAVTVVIGCYAQTAAQAIATMDGVDLVLGNDAKMLLPQHLNALTGGAPAVVRQRPEGGFFTVPFLRQGPPITRRVNLKIQDGCDFMCSYCYIPFARGRSRSRCFEDTLAEAQSLVERGAKELVLTGVNIGDYEEHGRGLAPLVDQLSALKPQPRVRISSIEAANLPETLFERMADPNHALVPHLHVPLQSGADSILKAMRRPYTAEEYLERLNRAARRVSGIGLGADVLVGFPGESDADFETTCTVIQQSPLAYLHIFQYSERQQVASSRLPGKVSVATIKARSDRLHQLAQNKLHDFHQTWLGRDLHVLFESFHDGLWWGHADNYLEVAAASKENLENQLAWVHIDVIHRQTLLGSITSNLTRE